MLQELRIKNFALINEASLELDPRCNVLTGETGAGKTVIIEAMNLILGGRADSTLIRSGETEAAVEGLFVFTERQRRSLLSVLGEGLDLQDELIIGRVISTEEKSRCYLNGRLVNLSLLAEIGRWLVDVHGQHEHQSLLHASEHLSYLDRYAGQSLLDLKDGYVGLHQKWQELDGTLRSLKQNMEEKGRQAELLKFQIEEIERADLRPDEEGRLLQEREVLRHAEKLFAVADFTHQAIAGSEEGSLGALDRLRAAQAELERASGIDARLDKLIESFKDILFEAEDSAQLFRDYKESVDFNPARLEEVEARLSFIDQMKKKYGQSIEEVLSYCRAAVRQLEALDASPEKIRQLESEKSEIENELAKAALVLSAKRAEVAARFEKEVQDQLAELNMARTRFKVAIDQEEEAEGLLVGERRVKPLADGIDRAEFLISPNIGETLRPLSKIASGGEISRIMLALKMIFGEADTIPTMIFDEVDAGIGGKTAAAVGQKLALLADNHQVICITHLPQIASCANRHFSVSKVEQDGRTLTQVEVLDEPGRIDEIARMISGQEISEASRRHARELIDSSLKMAIPRGLANT